MFTDLPCQLDNAAIGKFRIETVLAQYSLCTHMLWPRKPIFFSYDGDGISHRTVSLIG